MVLQRQKNSFRFCLFTIALSVIAARGDCATHTSEGQSTGIYSTTDIDAVLNAGSTFGDQFEFASQTLTLPAGASVCQQEVQPQPCCRQYVMPNGLLYRSYIAAPHEPRLASSVLYDNTAGSWRWDSTLGGRVGLYRRDSPPDMNLDAWQVDLEGAVMVRLDPQEKMDVESADFRFGLLWTGKKDNLAFKLGYFHVSSHVGDEYLIKNPAFLRINYVKESLIFGTSLQATPECRVYGEVAWGMIATGGAEPWQFQFGSEYAKIADIPTHGAPFSAMNIQMRQEVDFAAGLTLMSGWQWKGPDTGRTFRLGLTCFNGPSNQYQFYQRYDSQFGLGVWYDF